MAQYVVQVKKSLEETFVVRLKNGSVCRLSRKTHLRGDKHEEKNNNVGDGFGTGYDGLQG